MILEQIEARNFKKLRNFIWEFGRGIKIICGENESGKSTILDAILFALFGVGNEKKDDKLVNLISHGAQETWVSLKFSLKSEKHRVMRTIKLVKSKKADQEEKHKWGDVTLSKVLPNGKETPLASGTSEVTEMVKAMLGITVDEVLSSNVIAQKEMNRVSELQSKNWRDLFNKFLNLDCFTKAINETKDELSSRKNEATLAGANLEIADAARKRYCEILTNISGKVKDLYAKLKDLRLNDFDERDYRSRFDNLDKYITSLERQTKLREDLAALQEKEKELAQKITAIEALEAKNVELNLRVAEYPNLEVCRETLTQMKDAFTLIEQFYASVVQLTIFLADLRSKSSDLDAARVEFGAFNDLDAQIQRFSDCKSHLEIVLQKRTTIKKIEGELLDVEIAKKTLEVCLSRLANMAGLEKDNEILGQILIHHRKFKGDFEIWSSLNQGVPGLVNEVTKYQKKTKTPPEAPIPDIKVTMADLTLQKQNQFHAKDPAFRRTLAKVVPLLALGILLSALAFSSPYYLIPGLPLVVLGGYFLLLYVLPVLKIEARLSDLEILVETREKLEKLEVQMKQVEETLEQIRVEVTSASQQLALVQFKLEYAVPVTLASRFADEIQFAQGKLAQLADEKQKILEEIGQLETHIREETGLRDTLATERGNLTSSLQTIETFLHTDVPVIAPTLESSEVLVRVRADNYSNEERITHVQAIQDGVDENVRKRNAIDSRIKDLEPQVAKIPSVQEQYDKQGKNLVEKLNAVGSLAKGLPPRYSCKYAAKEFVVSQADPSQIDVDLAREAISDISGAIDIDDLAKSKLEAQIAFNQKTIDEKPSIQQKLGEQQILVQQTQATLDKLQIPELLPIVKKDITTRIDLSLERQKGLRRFYEETFLDRQAKIGNIKENIGTIKEELNTLHGDATRDAGVIDKYFAEKKRKEDLDHLVEVLGETQKQLEAVVADIREKHIPMIESFMNHYIERVTDGKYLKVKIAPPESAAVSKKFVFMMYDAEAGRYCKKEAFSGGTEDQYLLILRLAFAMSLLPLKKGTYPKFLFLDEIFSSSDLRRRNNILDLLQELTTDFEQIFIITHEQDIINDYPDAIRIQDGKIAVI